jgi:hypothetical protein
MFTLMKMERGKKDERWKKSGIQGRRMCRRELSL